MNKLFTLLSACSFAVAANAQTIYFEDDFEGGSLTGNNAWTIQTPTGTGTYDWMWDNFSGDNFAEAAAYDGSSDVDYETWLISPAIDLNSAGATDPTLTFATAANYLEATAPELELYVSTTYGGGAINMGDWTQITGFNLSSGSFSEVSSGDIDLSAYASATSLYIAYRYQSSAANGGGTYQVDDVLLKEGPTVTTIVPIYDIQYSTSGDSPELGNVVTTKGVVTGIYQVGSATGSFFIQDSASAWNGIYIFETGTTVAIGDSVEVTGEVLEFNGLTEIGYVSNVTILNSGNSIPAGIAVTNGTITDEEYEGVRVSLTSAECTAAPDQYGAWSATDGTASSIKVDDDLLPTTYNAVLGNYYDITGVRHFAFSENLLLPSSDAEVTAVAFASVQEDENAITLYPNPATDNVVINAQAGALVSVYSMSGQVVMEGVSNKTLDISALEAGIYQVVVTSNETKSTQKLIVK